MKSTSDPYYRGQQAAPSFFGNASGLAPILQDPAQQFMFNSYFKVSLISNYCLIVLTLILLLGDDGSRENQNEERYRANLTYKSDPESADLTADD